MVVTTGSSSGRFPSEDNGESGASSMGIESWCDGGLSSLASLSSDSPLVSIAASAASSCAVRSSSAIVPIFDLAPPIPGCPKTNVFISVTTTWTWVSVHLMISKCLYSQKTEQYMIFDVTPMPVPGNSLSGERRNMHYRWNELDQQDTLISC